MRVAGSGERVRAKPGTYLFIPPGVPHNIANASDKPARMIMTVSPPGHEHYFEELVKLVAQSGPPDASAIAKLSSRYRHRAAICPEGRLNPASPPISRRDAGYCCALISSAS